MLDAEFYKHYNFTQALKGIRKMLNVSSPECFCASWDDSSFEYKRDDSRKTLRYSSDSKVEGDG